MSHQLFKLFLLPVQRSTDEHGLTTPHIVPARPWAGTSMLGTALARLRPPALLPEHVARESNAALGGPRGRRGGGPWPREPCAHPVGTALSLVPLRLTALVLAQLLACAVLLIQG